MSTRAAPGPQLSTGRLRVDAARAIAKLREYQLVDRTAWVLEAIRAGVASGATKLALSSDANDIWLAWDGPAWPADDLPKLFDELVSPEPTDERHHLRLLAAAVNSALGTDPAYVDLYAVSPDATLRARYTPDVLVETAELEDSPLRRIAAEPASVPTDLAPETGMLVHVRRRTALGMLTYLFWEREQPELATARAACRDLAVPITIGSTTYCRTDLGHDLVRMPLGGDLDGYVAIRDPDAPRPAFPDATFEIAERGVLLATYPLAISPTGGSSTSDVDLRAPVPVRVFVDAKRMPTNASRSQVRREVPPISTAERRGPEQASKLIADLAKQVAEPGCDERKRKAACALVASVIAGPQWSSECFAMQVSTFGTLSLIRDAAGVPRPLRHAWSGHVYTGKTPLDPALGPWVSSIAWIPRGDPAARIVAGTVVDAAATKARIAWAKKQHKAHTKFFRHPARAAALTVKRPPRVRLRLGAKHLMSVVHESRFANMTGEVGVSFERGDGELLLLFQGRPIERLTLPSPIGFDAVIDALELTPGDRFRSVERDAHFRLVERAVQAALVCAAEIIASELGGERELPAGITTGPRASHELEARAVRTGLVIAQELQLPRPGLLADAPAWRTYDGRWVKFHEVMRNDVIGFATGVHRFTPPARRLILMGGKEQVAKLRPTARLVDYDKGRSGDDDRVERPARLAAGLAASHGFALAIAGDDVCGAIAPAAQGVILLHHIGCALDTRSRPSSLAPCAILADSDAIIPDVDWKAAGDTGGVHEHDFRPWEVELVRAALAALAGERPLELHGPEITIESSLSTWALQVLARAHTPPIFGPRDAALLERFKKAPFLHVLGERDLISIETLVKRFPGTIYFVSRTAAPVEGFAPLVADAEVAAGIGAIAGVPVADGSGELELRRKAAARKGRLVVHRALNERAFVYPFQNEPHVPIDPSATSLSVKGLVGVGRNRLEIDVRLENRTFATLTRQHDLPLYAVVDLALLHVNEELTGLSELVAAQLFEVVRRTAQPLLLSIAKHDPASLGDLGPPRTLLRAALAAPGVLSPTARDELRFAPAFSTIQGGRTSVAIASSPRNVLQIADWQSDWLAAGDGEPATSIDQDVLRVKDAHGELPEVLRQLAASVVDVSDEVIKLQSRRRMARGLVPMPALPHISNELKRKLSELGEIGQRLGHGEIGLVTEPSSALIHDHGVLRQRVMLDVLPGVQLAIEAPELLDVDAELPRNLDTGGSVADQLARLRDLGRSTAKAGPRALATDAQVLVQQLLAAIFAAGHGEGLDDVYKARIRQALIAKRILPEVVTVPVFEVLGGGWVGIDALDAQIEKYGNAWAVTGPTRHRPLDDDRLVFVFAPDELTAAYGKYAVIDATNELQLDDKARSNRDRPKATSLELRGRDYLLAQGELDGDGVTKPRGIVAPLLPHAAGQRGLYTHKEMTPFDLMTDPCKWPTLAMVDDARLEPDRTWEKPRTGTTSWADVSVRVGAASERALSQLVPRPPDAIAHVLVNASSPLGHAAARTKVQVRGAVWLRAAPRPPLIPIEVIDAYGRHLYVPDRPLGIGGLLYVHAPEGWDRTITLAEAVPLLYWQLVRQLLGRKQVSDDLVAAHVATALAMKVMGADELGGRTFPCFRPEPLDAAQLATLFAGSDPVRVLSLVDLEMDLLDPDAEGVVEDGSELSQVVIAQLGPRARYGALPRPKKKAVVRTDDESLTPPPVVPIVVEPATPPPPSPVKVEPPKPKREHPIQNVVDAVTRRLVDLDVPSFGVAIGDGEGAMVSYQHHRLRFAGAHRRLHAIANAIRANSPWAPLAIDALAAHAITVLDEARSEVNAQTVQDTLVAILLDS